VSRAARRPGGAWYAPSVRTPLLLLAIAGAAAGCNQLLDIEDPPPAAIDAPGTAFRIGGRIQERYKDEMNVTMFRAADGAQVDLVAGGEVVSSAVASATGEYLVELPAGAPPDVIIRGRRLGDLENAVFPGDPIRADATLGFTLYTEASVAALASSVTVVHAPTDRYVLVRVFDVVGGFAGAVINSSSGGVRYADAANVLTPSLTQTTSSGLAAIFAVKTPSITVTVTSALGTVQRELALDPALTAFLQIHPN
jgi:hypothetical protein